jgi:hypothetical protein
VRDSEAVIQGLDMFSQLASIEGATMRAPEGQHDRAVAFVLGLKGEVKVLRIFSSAPFLVLLVEYL